MRLRIYDGRAASMAAFIAAAWLAALLIVIAFFWTKAAAFGWLVGWIFWMQILVGCLALNLIHRLTGGCWGELIAPIARPSAALIPLLIILAVPLFVAIPTLYPWPHRPDAIKPGVISYYLNTPWFIGRSMLALIGWSVLALLLPRTPGFRGQLLAALGLVFFALLISSVSIDWYLSLEAPFTSSSFGASVAISALIAGLGWTALLARMTDGDPAIGDVGGLLLATILGIIYIDFMALLVIWYGDLPREEIWFVERLNMPWMAMGLLAFLLAALFPVLGLLLSKIRNGRNSLRLVAAVTLVGLACYDAYLVAPPGGAFALVPSAIAITAIGLVVLGLFRSVATAPLIREQANAR